MIKKIPILREITRKLKEFVNFFLQKLESLRAYSFVRLFAYILLLILC